MKKRVISLILAVFTIVVMLPSTAGAYTNGHSAAEALSYVRSLVGRDLDYDGKHGAQCVDLIAYYYAYLGCAAYIGGNACDYAWNTLPPGWNRYKGVQPQPGDILVYSGNESNPYGHVAIYEADRVTYHQNLDYIQKVQCSGYRYNGLYNPYWGVIRPDFGTDISFSWEGPVVNNISETNAFPKAKINFGIKLHTVQCGLVIYDNDGNIVSRCDEHVNYNSTYVSFEYDINAELHYTLVSGKTYKLRFYTLSNGKEYWSNCISFTTRHTHKYASVTIKPTCYKKGYVKHTCSCGDSYIDSYTDTIPHKYDTSVTEATCSTPGYITRKCSVCGFKVKKENAAALGHNFTGKVRINSDNTISYKCTRCDKYGGTVTPQLRGVFGTKRLTQNKSDILIAPVEMTVSTVLASINYGKVVDEFGRVITNDKTNLSTGMKVQLGLNSVSISVAGDVDGDGKISVYDARLALRAAVKLDILSGAYFCAANVDFDDKISVSDARFIIRAAVKLDDPKKDWIK